MINIPPSNAAAILLRLSGNAQEDASESLESKDNTPACDA
jgi:hypothetical protein